MYLTEKELLLRQEEQIFGIQRIIKNSNVSLDDISEFVPGLVHLNKIHSLELCYVDKRSRQMLGVKKEELKQKGQQILMKVVKPESFQQAKQLFSNMDFKDPSKVASHFQALKGLPDPNSYKWYFSVKKRFNDQLLLTISNPVQSLGPLQKQMEKILEENLFIRKNLPAVNTLTKREKEIMTLIAQGFNSNQIAEQLFISPHTVSTHRKKIWQKLEIKNYKELIKFAAHFDLL